MNPHKRECFDTLGFFYVQEHKPSPRPPICSFECCRLALPCTLITIIERYRESIANTLLLSLRFSLKTKNPGVFSSRVLELDTVVYYVRTLGLLECSLLDDHRHVTRQMSD